MSNSLASILEQYREQATLEKREMARRLKVMPLGAAVEMLSLVALNHASIFVALLDDATRGPDGSCPWHG
jgi:hypothetical protein